MARNILKIRSSKLFIFMFLSAVFFLSVYPLFENGIVYQSNYQDLDYHILRIESIKNEILLGNFPPYIHSTFLNGYGYGNGLFYPELLLYFPALLRILGLSISASYKFFVVFITALTVISSYFSIKYISKNRYVSLCFSALFVLSQYRLSNVYIRGAVGEYCAYIFIPIVAAGIYDFLYNDFRKPWILGLGFLGLFLTHTISFAVAIVLILIVFIFNLKYIYMNKALVIKLLITAGAVILLTSFYWGPMLEQCFSGKFEFNDSWVEELGIMPTTANRIFDNSYFIGIGLPIILLTIIRLFITRRSKSKLSPKEAKLFKLSDKFLIIGLIFTYMATYLFPWHLLKNTLFNNIQFPWRLLSFASMFLSAAIAIYIHLFVKGKQRSIALISVFVITAYYGACFINPYISIMKYTPGEQNDYFSKSENTFAIRGSEWLPIGTEVQDMKDPYNVITESGKKIPLTKSGSTVTFVINDSESTNYDIPLLYYKGYSAELKDDKGEIHKLIVSKSQNNNLVRVCTDNMKGKITVRYSGTAVQKISVGINILSALIFEFICYIYYKKRKKLINSPAEEPAEKVLITAGSN